jgi:hypothetical protein
LKANDDFSANLAEQTSDIVTFANAERFQELNAKVG